MSSELETKLLAKLRTPEAVGECWDVGVRPDLFEEPLYQAVFNCIVEYWRKSQMTAVPTEWVLSQEYPGFTQAPEGEETTAYLADLLRRRYVTNQLQEMVRSAAADSVRDPIGALKGLHAAAYAASEVVTPRITRVNLGETIEDFKADYERAENYPQGTGVPYGLDLLDLHTGGLLPGELAVVGARAKTGKAQPLTARVATPTGWTTMGALAVGDFVLGSDGLPQKVTGVFDQGLKEVWEVHTGGGVVIEACAEHLWVVGDKAARGRERVITTEEISRSVRLPHRQNRPRFTIPMPSPAEYEPQSDSPLDPYLMGLLLGDGGMTGTEVRFTNPELELHQELERRLPPQTHVRQVKQENRCRSVAIVRSGGSSNVVIDSLRDLGLWGCRSVEKFIPDSYKFASVSDRVLLVQGLMDTDGTCGKGGYIEFFSSSLRLAQDFREVVQSLGGTATLFSRPAPKYQHGEGNPAYRVGVRLPGQWPPFLHSTHKRDRLRLVRREPSTNISEVRRTGRFVEMRCISVSNSDRLYRTEGHTLTHNTMFLLHAAAHALRQGYRPMVFTLEMSIKEINTRLAALFSGVSYDRLSHRRLRDTEKDKLWAALEEYQKLGGISVEAPEEGDRTVASLLARARQYGADYLIIDQLSEMEAVGRTQTLKEHHAQVVKALKREIGRVGMEIPCLLAAQLRRNDEEITLESFSNATEIEAAADILLGLWRNQDMRNNAAMALKILGSRRSDIADFVLNWELGAATEISVESEVRG